MRDCYLIQNHVSQCQQSGCIGFEYSVCEVTSLMFFDPRDLLLKEKITLYNNIAESGDCRGRLLAELQVYPSPQITWEFESLGASACEPTRSQTIPRKLENPLAGSWFSIDEQPYVSGERQSNIGTPTILLKGVAPRAYYGDVDVPLHSFKFYLPNARFQGTSLEGQEFLETTVRAGGKRMSGGTGGRRLDVPLDDEWNISLMTERDALDWLAPTQNNIGTLITTRGQLYPIDEDNGGKDKFPTLTMTEAQRRLGTLSVLLSFANGGYLGPVYIEGMRNGEIAAAIVAYHTTPLELFGNSWLTGASDLAAYLKCFSALDKMLNTTPWNEAFHLILVWYLQAIQRQNMQLGKHWTVVANAVGAALERLSYTILVEELQEIDVRDWKNSRKYPARKRIERLLEKIGLTTKSPAYGDIGFVKDFVDIRNDATHARSTLTLTNDMRNQIMSLAIQWVEETLLWRLGYDGGYCSRRLFHPQPILQPRYDLNTREANW